MKSQNVQNSGEEDCITSLLCVNTFLLTRQYHLFMILHMETKRPANPTTSNRLALYFVGVREGFRLHLLGVRSWGFNSPHVHTLTIGPTGGGNQRQGTSSGRSRKDGVSRPAVIFALGSEESKGENDVPQLPDRMQKVWENSQRPAAVSPLPMLQKLF
jgi:hypothetical protein